MEAIQKLIKDAQDIALRTSQAQVDQKLKQFKDEYQSMTSQKDLAIRELTVQLNEAQMKINEYQSQMNASPLEELTGVLTKLLNLKQESI